MKHSDMSKLFFVTVFKIIFVYIAIIFVRLKDVRNTFKFRWTAHNRFVSYRPSVDGKRCGCKAWIKIRDSDWTSVIVPDDDHLFCAKALKRARVSDISGPILNATINDLSAETLALCKARAVENTSISAQIIADEHEVHYVGR